MKIYLSGPITGVADANVKFYEAASKIRSRFPEAEIINPEAVMSELPPSTTHDEYMIISCDLLNMCDAIVMLPGWEMSKGACIEYGYSLNADKLIIMLEDIEVKEELSPVEYVKYDDVYEMLNGLGGCDASDAYDKGWDKAIDAAISALSDIPNKQL